MRRSVARWAVALRIARRSALTSRGRSLLIVLLIAAPVAGLAGAAVLLPSTQSTLEERIQGTLGSAQARIQVIAGPSAHVRQGVEGGYDYAIDPDADPEDPRIDPRSVLPRSTRVLAIGGGVATFRTARGTVSLAAVSGPSWDPSLDGGPFVLLSGQRPSSADEVLLSPSALARLGATVGGTVRMLEPVEWTVRVVGTSRDRGLPGSDRSVFLSSALLPSADDALDTQVFYVPSAQVDWATVQRLNAAGATVFSREVVLDPPVLPEDQRFEQGGWRFDAASTAAIALVLTFAVLEVALLAGSAFLVGARLQQRALATVASVGADRAVLRRVVTAGGVVLGALGGVAGTALGVVGALGIMRLTDDGSWTRYPGVHLVWPLLGGIVVFGVLVGWIAALVPARAAARFDVVRALRGARPPQRTGRKPVLGLVLLATGIGATLAGGTALFAALKERGDESTGAQIGALALLGGGPVLAQLGVLLCSGLVLRTIAAVLGRGPLSVRLAARDTARNLGRAVPAVAAVMTTVFVAAFVMCLANSASLISMKSYFWQAARVGDGVSYPTRSDGEPVTRAFAADWREALERALPVRSAETVAATASGPGDATSDRARDALAIVRLPELPADCDSAARIDPADLRCGSFTANGGSGSRGAEAVTVGTPAALAALLGHAPSAEAARTLAAGGAVVLRSDLAPGGVATLDWFTPKQFGGDLRAAVPRRSTAVRAVVDLPEHPIGDSVFVTPSTAKRLHLKARPNQILLSFTRPPTDDEVDAATSAVSALAGQPDTTGVTVEQGPQDYGAQIAWWILLACLVIAVSAGATAVGLARADGRADDVTLASLGAARRIRRSVGSVQALIVCGLGAVIGTGLGLLPAVALGAATTSLPFVPPTLQLVLVAGGIPVVIAAGCWFLVGTRRADLTRRTAIA